MIDIPMISDDTLRFFRLDASCPVGSPYGMWLLFAALGSSSRRDWSRRLCKVQSFGVS